MVMVNMEHHLLLSVDGCRTLLPWLLGPARHGGLLLPDLGDLVPVECVALEAVLVLHVRPQPPPVLGHRGRPAPRVHGVVHLIAQAAHSPAPGLGRHLPCTALLNK